MPKCNLHSILESLDLDLYKVKTRHGVYKKKENATDQDFLETGELAEISCAADNVPIRLPLYDRNDDNSTDETITLFCLYTSAEDNTGKLNMMLSDLPPCVPVCPGKYIPMAPNGTDLQLKYVIPRANKTTKVDYMEYLKMNRKGCLFSGDHLVYQCLTKSWGVHGGFDIEHDAFRFK